jgi:hypothetical protein
MVAAAAGPSMFWRTDPRPYGRGYECDLIKLPLPIRSLHGCRWLFIDFRRGLEAVDGLTG